MFKSVDVKFTRYRHATPRRLTRDGIVPSSQNVGLTVNVTATAGAIDWVNVVFARGVYRRIHGTDGPLVISGTFSQTIKFGAIGAGEARAGNLPVSDTTYGAWGAQAMFTAETLVSGLKPYHVYGQLQDGRVFEERIGRARDLTVEIRSPQCFIATTAFADEDHPTVQELRLARDEILVRTRSGRRFIDWYYRNGPKMAHVVGSSRILRAMCRGALRPIAWSTRVLRTALAPRSPADPG